MITGDFNTFQCDMCEKDMINKHRISFEGMSFCYFCAMEGLE